MNKVILMGRLTREPEMRTANNNLSIARYTLAIDRPFRQGEERQTDFINCVCFGNTADFAKKYLHKGTKIVIGGRIQTGNYEKDGVKHYTTDIVVSEHFFCEKKSDNAAQSVPEGYTVVEDDPDDALPF